jgi:hypothetical protein
VRRRDFITLELGDVGGDAPRFVAQLGDELFVAGKSPHYIFCKVPVVPTK